MHLKFRRSSALLYRSRWVPKGAVGDRYGYASGGYRASY